MWFIVVAVIILIFAGYKLSEILTNRRSLNLLLALKQYEPYFNQALLEFKNLEKQNWYISDRQYRLWKAKYQNLADNFSPVFYKVKTSDPFKKLVTDFADLFFRGRELVIDKHNENFVIQESPTIRKILNTKEIQNNNDQVTAIASDEDNTLLVAGAGTGKTTTILGKLAYLIERIKVGPEDILLLSFTGRAVQELADRISSKFPGKNIKAQTFHSFGLSIIGKTLGKKPDLAFSTASARQKFLNEQFDLHLKDKRYLNLVIEYFAYYLKPVVLEPGFKNLDDYYKYSKTERNLTLQKEPVKSQQEVMIANFLYINGINYKYEMPYKYETANRDYRQYKPDFYLPDYDIYIEHFGIDRHGKVHFTQSEAQNAHLSEKYQADIKWKKELHKEHKTTLIEAFSYEFNEHNWKEKLTEQLKAHNVRFSERNIDEIFKSLKEGKTIPEIIELFGTFLDLSKSNGYLPETLRDKILQRGNAREIAFSEIFIPILKAYEDYLVANKSIDFHDMLIKAAGFINEGRHKTNFKYIIIDEFQDFSVSKYKLIKAICDQCPDIKLFCVGDDWQSIFRFAGSDISLMTNFEESYGFTRKNQLVITNRFNNRLAVISNRFILKNPNQISKEVKSDNAGPQDAVEILYKRKRDIDGLLGEIFSTINTNGFSKANRPSVFLLGRYKHNKPDNFLKYQNEFKHLSIEFLTIHASKGAEADFVIIMDVLSGKYGFPSEVTDDPLLEIVLSKSDSYPHAEERRLMYVAMTRARHKAFIITEDGSQSVFVLELEGSQNTGPEKLTCGDCSGTMIKRRGPYGEFWGCSNFPDCTYRINIRSKRRGR